jgi:hypothetical protein
MYKIEKSIPIPTLSTRRLRSPITATLRQLEVGDSFVVPVNKKDKAFSGHLHGYSRRAGVRITVRRIDDNYIRVWRIADKDAGKKTEENKLESKRRGYGLLKDEHKSYIVMALARFINPAQVIKDLQSIFNVTVTIEHVRYYDPTKGSADKRLHKKWRQLFEETRLLHQAQATIKTGERDVDNESHNSHRRGTQNLSRPTANSHHPVSLSAGTISAPRRSCPRKGVSPISK